MSTISIYKESFSCLHNTSIIFEGDEKQANKFFNDYIKSKGYARKDATKYKNGNKKIGSIITQNLIKLDI